MPTLPPQVRRKARRSSWSVCRRARWKSTLCRSLFPKRPYANLEAPDVRAEVSPLSHEWGYKLGSVYIRKVHFRDVGMVRQIEEKVVNRLRQVTSAILQDGANRVSIITNSAERQAAVEFAKANAMRPRIVGAALQEIGKDPDVAEVMFEILETENLLSSEAGITLLPEGKELLTQLMASETVPDGDGRR